MTSHMEKEIGSQPQMLRARAAGWAARARALRARPHRDHLVLIGRGSSGHATTFATYLHALRTGRHPIDFRPWLATQQLPSSDWSDARVFAYSASGESTDIAHASKWLRDHGADVIGITCSDDPACALGRSTNALFRLGIGQEVAVPATKSFVAQIFASAALIGHTIETSAAHVADGIEAMLDSDLRTHIADFVGDARTIIWLARGTTLGAALDAALKIQETARIPSFAYSAAEYLHGPIGASGPEDRVIILADRDREDSGIDQASAALQSRGTPVRMLGETGEDDPWRVPLPPEAWASCASFAVASQLTALELASRRGLDPDVPVGLKKITRT